MSAHDLIHPNPVPGCAACTNWYPDPLDAKRAHPDHVARDIRGRVVTHDGLASACGLCAPTPETEPRTVANVAKHLLMLLDRARAMADRTHYIQVSAFAWDDSIGMVMGDLRAAIEREAAQESPASRPELEDLAVLIEALTIGRISWDGDGWYAKDAGYDYDHAEEVLSKASAIIRALVERLAPEPPASPEARE